MGILATSAIGAKLLPMLNATKLSLKQIIINGTRAAAPFLAMAAALTAVGLVLEDIYGWTQGDISLTGALIGRFDQWADKFQVVGKLAHGVWLNIKGLLRDIAKLANVDLDLSNWQGFATSVMNYVIDGLKNLIKIVGSVVRIIRALVNGDFSGAFSNAGKLIDGLSLKFLPFYSIALTVISGIISLFWVIFSPLKLLGKAFFSVGTIIGKGFKFAIFIIKPFISILLFTKKAIFLVGKAFLFASKMMIKAIWAVARAMFVAMASNPILLAIGLVLGAIELLIIYWDDVKRIALAVWDAISTKASETWEGVKTTATNKWNEVTNTFKNAWQQSIDTVVGWFESLIPSWIKDLFSSGAKAEVNVTGAAMVTPTIQYVQPTSTLPSYTKYGGNMQSTVTQTNNFNIQGTANPAGVANAVSGKLKQNRPAPFGVGSIEYAG
ncbi:hypothetical protein N8E86_10360 [Avibacterium paragallinarum]|uniref:hypothetical protein n=1 Tax=Avibacterium paragallinarum TaxID=728 RepID=UPI0021F74655|nr:hypothetical protein [Avibacterium paragallinarum]UXN34441.1 hypothetical protein N8E86_10360 [Avibacterium paragallinarum]